MRWLLAGLLVAHGIAHVVGFVVPWKLLASKEMPYRTTILSGSVDLGETGARLLGLVWLGVAVGFAIAGAGVLARVSWWYGVALALVVVSVALCVAG